MFVQVSQVAIADSIPEDEVASDSNSGIDDEADEVLEADAPPNVALPAVPSAVSVPSAVEMPPPPPPEKKVMIVNIEPGDSMLLFLTFLSISIS